MKTPSSPRIKVDHARREVFVNKNGRLQEIVLAPAEYGILHALMTANKAMTRDDLGRALGYEDGRVEMASAGRVLDQHVCRLRRKIGPGIIGTIPSYGYRFDGHK